MYLLILLTPPTIVGVLEAVEARLLVSLCSKLLCEALLRGVPLLAGGFTATG